MSICYAPLNRLVSVYRPALRETISQVDPFILSLSLSALFAFHFSLVSFIVFEYVLRKLKQHAFWQVCSMLNFYSQSSELRVWRAPHQFQYTGYGSFVSIRPYGVSRQ